MMRLLVLSLDFEFSYSSGVAPETLNFHGTDRAMKEAYGYSFV